MTQKILNSKQGEFQNVYGDSVKIAEGNKLLFTKRFMSPQLIYQIPQSNNSQTKDFSNTFCAVTYDYKVDRVSQFEIDDVRNRYPYIKFEQRLDTTKPIYIFETTAGDKNVAVYKDHTYSESLPSEKNRNDYCLSDEPNMRSNYSYFLIQYLDENSMAMIMPEYSDQYADLMERPTLFYKSIEADALDSTAFMSKLESFDSPTVSVRLTFQHKDGKINFSKQDKTFLVTMPSKDDSKLNTYDGCNYRLKLVYDSVHKTKFDSLMKWHFKSRLSNFSLDSSLHFLNVAQFKFESLNNNQLCVGDADPFKLLETKPSEFLVGIHYLRGALELFIYSFEKMDIVFSAGILPK